MGLKIHEYPNEAFQINDEDFYDVDYWNGVDYETRKISGATLKAELSGGGGLDVGTTAVTNGTDNRVFFQAGGVLEQSANFTFDTGDLRIGNGAISSKSGIRVWNGTTTNTAGAEFYIGIDNNIYLKTNNANNIKISTPTTDVINVTSNQASITRLNVNGASTTPTFSIGAEGTSTSTYPFYISGLASSRIHIMNGAGQFGLNKPNNTLGANLDVSASGALSTDIAFRVRNSADTLNTFQCTGDGKTKMSGSIYFAEFDPSNGFYVGNNYGNQWNLSGILNGTSYMTNGADSKLALGKTTASYRLDIQTNGSPVNGTALRIDNANGELNGSIGMVFTNTWTGSTYGNIGGIFKMKHTHLGGGGSLQNCQFDFDLNYNDSVPTTRASVTGRSNILIGTPTENTDDSHTIYIQNGTAPTVALSGGGKLYVEGGALKYIGSSGTITTIAVA